MKKFLSILLSVILIISICPMGLFSITASAETGNITEFAGGSGTVEDPYLIINKSQLNNVRNYPAACFKLLVDIEYSNNETWQPIENFSGTFDGGNKSIINLKITEKVKGGNSYFYGYEWCTGFCAYNTGTIKNLKISNGILSVQDSSGSITCGFIAGDNSNGIIQDCEVSGEINATAKYRCFVGGLSGYGGDIVRCKNSSDLTIKCNTGSIGGISGHNNASVYCENYGNVSVEGGERTNCGGIVGSGFKIAYSCNYGDIGLSAAKTSDVPYANAGGICGSSHYVENCYNTGDVISKTYGYSQSPAAGGIVGELDEGIKYCYSTGNVTASGDVYYTSSYILWAECYAGGIVGKCYETSIIDSVFSMDSCLIKSTCYGNSAYNIITYENAISTIGIKYNSKVCTEQEMKNINTFTGFDFTNDWTIESEEFPQIKNSNIKKVKISDSDIKKTIIEDGTLEKIKIEVEKENGYKYTTYVDATSLNKAFYNSYENEDFYKVVYNGVLSENVIKIKVEPLKVIGIQIDKLPDKTEYVLGQEYDYSGCVVKKIYNNGILEDINNEELSFDCNTNLTGVVPVKISYAGLDTFFDIIVNERNIKQIFVTPPNKCTYVQDQKIDLTGGYVNVVFESEDDYTEKIPLTQDMLEVYASDQIGKQEIFVTYENKVASFEIEIIKKEAQSVEIISEPQIVAVYQGNEIDLNGGKLKVTYVSDDLYTEIIPMDQTMISNFDKNKIGLQLVTVTCGNVSDTFYVNVLENPIVNIYLKEKPNKLIYLEAKENFDAKGGMLSIVRKDGSETNVDLDDSWVIGFDNSIIGTQILTVEFEGFTVQFTIEIKEKSLSGISVLDNGIKKEYLESKETLDVSNGKLRLNYDNDTYSDIVLLESMVSGFDNTTVGSQTLTVTYGGFTDTYNIKIITKTLQSISLANPPFKTTYLLNKEKLSVEGGKIILNYNNDTTETIEIKENMITGFDNSKIGEQNLTVHFNGKTTSFSIVIIDVILGDIDGVEGVTDRDAVYLLYHTFLSDIYPVNQDCDFNGDGEVNDKDAVYLLYYTFLPDLYPIN